MPRLRPGYCQNVRYPSKEGMKLADFEKTVLRIMLKSEFSQSDIEEIISESSISGYDYTGAGYFLELTNKLFPTKRKVISEPTLVGKIHDIKLGFVLFLENNSLTLECHGWGYINPPKDVRARKITIDRFRNEYG